MKFTYLNKIIALGSVILFVAACSQKTAPASALSPDPKYDGPKVTYTKDIAPIMERSCAPCHYPKMDGNKEALDTYEAVKNELEDVVYRVQLPSDHFRHMPYRGKKPDLSAEEIQMLKNWARGGFIES